jgi:outer membrane protein TolC
VEQADLLPQITGLVAGSRVRPVSATTGQASDPSNRYGPSVTLSYMLFDFARGDQIEAAEYRLLAANLNQNRVLQDIIFQVEQAYYRLLGLDLLVRVNELTLTNLRTSLDAAGRRRESGLATVADVYRAETQVAQADLNLTRSRGELDKARGQLATAVGVAVNSTLRVQTVSVLPQVPEVTASLTDLLDRARAARPDLVAAEAQARAARSTADAASKAGFPTVELAATAGKTFFTDERAPASNYSFGFNVRIPIFNGFRDRYAYRLAEAQYESANAARDSLYRQTELDVWQAYYDLQTAATGVGTTESQVKSAEQTAQATLARYEAGFGSILDLITAQQDESNARVQRIQSYLDWYTALARLQFSTGYSDIIAAASGKK